MAVLVAEKEEEEEEEEQAFVKEDLGSFQMVETL